MDKELAILDQIQQNESISQREVSDNTGISLGNVNLLLKKMVKEGLIKIEQIPANRVAYILTPKGMLEKANKTYNYIKHHYSYIEKQKKTIYRIIEQIQEEYTTIQIIIADNEVFELYKLAREGSGDILLDHTQKDKADINLPVIVMSTQDEQEFSDKGYIVINILKMI